MTAKFNYQSPTASGNLVHHTGLIYDPSEIPKDFIMKLVIGQLYPFVRLFFDDLQKLMLCSSVVGGLNFNRIQVTLMSGSTSAYRQLIA
jgi:hypothetical protein